MEDTARVYNVENRESNHIQMRMKQVEQLRFKKLEERKQQLKRRLKLVMN